MRSNSTRSARSPEVQAEAPIAPERVEVVQRATAQRLLLGREAPAAAGRDAAVVELELASRRQAHPERAAP